MRATLGERIEALVRKHRGPASALLSPFERGSNNPSRLREVSARSLRPFRVTAWAAAVERLDSVVANGAFLPTMSAMCAERSSKQMDDFTSAVIDQQFVGMEEGNDRVKMT